MCWLFGCWFFIIHHMIAPISIFFVFFLESKESLCESELVKSFREQPTKYEFFLFFSYENTNQCYALIIKILTGEVQKY